MNSILTFENVNFTYGEIPVIIDASFCLHAGKPMCVVGPNGGGKTTLLKLILGITQPDSGTIKILGKSPMKARQDIGYMPQSIRFDPKFPITVDEVVGMGLMKPWQLGFWNKPDTDQIKEALEAVNLTHRGNEQFANLSGGQRQRVLIARAIVSKPKLLLLDEPTANLDLTLESQLLETLQDFHPDMTIIMVSHDLGFVSETVEEVLCVNRTIHSHTTESISPELIEELYGTSPRRVLHHTDLTHTHGHKEKTGQAHNCDCDQN